MFFRSAYCKCAITATWVEYRWENLIRMILLGCFCSHFVVKRCKLWSVIDYRLISYSLDESFCSKLAVFDSHQVNKNKYWAFHWCGELREQHITNSFLIGSSDSLQIVLKRDARRDKTGHIVLLQKIMLKPKAARTVQQCRKWK